MTSGASASICSKASRDGDVDPELRALLDHIAVDLAEEYVRLMETAAKAKHGDQELEEPIS